MSPPYGSNWIDSGKAAPSRDLETYQRDLHPLGININNNNNSRLFKCSGGKSTSSVLDTLISKTDND
jgi:hypothetical protein